MQHVHEKHKDMSNLRWNVQTYGGSAHLVWTVVFMIWCTSVYIAFSLSLPT